MLKFSSKETAEMLCEKIVDTSIFRASIAGVCIIGVSAPGARLA
jgi:hypothetical protein